MGRCADVQNYTILGDLGLISVNTEDPSDDDVSTRFLPIQWAIESVRISPLLNDEESRLKQQNFIALATGTEPAAPLSWQYTTQTQEELDESQRQCMSLTGSQCQS